MARSRISPTSLVKYSSLSLSAAAAAPVDSNSSATAGLRPSELCVTLGPRSTSCVSHLSRSLSSALRSHVALHLVSRDAPSKTLSSLDSLADRQRARLRSRLPVAAVFVLPTKTDPKTPTHTHAHAVGSTSDLSRSIRRSTWTRKIHTHNGPHAQQLKVEPSPALTRVQRAALTHHSSHSAGRPSLALSLSLSLPRHTLMDS